MSINHVAFHLDIAAQNPAGTVFSNPPKKVVVIRWEASSDFSAMMSLAENALTDLNVIGADTLIYDLRRVPEAEGSVSDIAIRQHCLQNDAVHRFGILSAKNTPSEGIAELSATIEEVGAHVVTASNFDELVALLESPLPAEERLLTQPLPQDYAGTYAGSVYAIPELTTVVIRTAGNIADLELAKHLFVDGIELARKTGANSLIMDTSATPPIADLNHYHYAHTSVVVPLAKCGLFRQVVHVRAGDALMPEGIPQLAPLVTSFGVPFYDVALMEEAVALLRLLLGRPENEVPLVNVLSK